MKQCLYNFSWCCNDNGVLGLSTDDRFEGVQYTEADNGCPILMDAVAYVQCIVKSRMETSDHWICYGEAVSGKVSKPDSVTAAHYRKVGNYY